ncbi:MAG TPA: LLM class flavin-dependent oxidoreductase [Methylomirabilota bacterium]|jgi:alkanesulfonate monooxygenase SsuD/methylene tetrahydromethanopterin reductase-like flavin-dependent oxidoreductase (luciferase family)|nr:LLM class flavin-dependent oxidoreductase [Methylomirabilota bacterium]
MKVGMTLQLTSFGGKPDLETYQDELSLADMAEDLGFDSIWGLDHHFTGYVMSPDPCQLLSYIAGRTKRVQLGTAVIVLPWHDPVEIAEKIALLDLLSGGRTIFGFGRGAASIEYAGFRIPMEEARERFVESAIIIRKGLTQASFSHDGKYYQVPEIQIRPRPISHPENRFYASTVSPESAEIMAKMGFGVLIIAQRSWEDTAADYRRYCEAALASGYQPRPPIGLFNVLVADDAHEAEDLAQVHMGAMFDSIDRHYRFSDGHLSSVKGYEFYAKMAKTYAKLSVDEQAKVKAVEFYRSLHAAGTPAQVLEKIRYIHHTVPLEHMIATFAFGGLPYPKLERSFKLFAEKILPVLHNDPAFRLPEEQFRGVEVGANVLHSN